MAHLARKVASLVFWGAALCVAAGSAAEERSWDLPYFDAVEPRVDEAIDESSQNAESRTEATDPRVIEADGYLGDRKRFKDAIALYRDYLGGQPDDHVVRLRLARVISWRGDLEAALLEYDRIDPAQRNTEIRVERAEVLSWATRYREAEDELKAVLEGDPQNARAARALARLYRWSGRDYEADRAYIRALELDDDDEARGEWEGLRGLYRPHIATRFSRRTDSDDFLFQSLETEGSTYLSLRTRVHAAASYTRARGDRLRSDGRRDRQDRDGSAYSVAVERHLDKSWLATALIGHEVWAEAPDQVRARGELRFTPSERTSWNLAYEHGGAGRVLDSFDAVTEGVRRDEFELSLWRDLPGAFELFGFAGGGLISDSNSRVLGNLSLSYKPLQDHKLRFDLSSGVLSYRDRSALYYDPEWDVSNQLHAEYERPLFLGLRFRMGAGVGHGVSEENDTLSSGFTFSGSSYLWWEWRRWAFEAGAAISQSRRESRYRSTTFSAGISRSF